MDSTNETPLPRRGEIVVIQQLRGLAALLVVIYHALAPVEWIYYPLLAKPGFGQGGVDIFFVISGCVMYVAARRESVGEFALKRLLRIVPLYWLATLVFAAIRFGHWGEPGLDTASLSSISSTRRSSCSSSPLSGASRSMAGRNSCCSC